MGVGAALVCSAGLLTTGALPAPAAPDPGAQKKSVDRKINQLEDHLDETSAALSKAYRNLKATQDKLPAARTVLEKARAAADAADHAQAVATQELEVARANEAKARTDLKSATAEVAAGRKRIAQFAAQIYQEQGFGQLDVALSSTEPQDFADRLAMVDTVLDVQTSTMARLTTEQANLTALEDHLSALRADSAAKKKAAEAALARAEKARDAAAAAKAQLDALAASQEKQAKSYEDQLSADKKQLKEMQAEQARLQEDPRQARRRGARPRRRGRCGGGQAPGRGREEAQASRAARAAGPPVAPPAAGPPVARPRPGILSRPVRSGWVSSEYGMRFHPLYKYWKLHSGRDYAANCGVPVYASAPGSIVMAGWGGGYGNRVVIDHGLENNVGLASAYNHLSRVTVGGGSVSRGQLIGYVGDTGTSTGCHLHFETLENGDFVDPRKWLNTLG